MKKYKCENCHVKKIMENMAPDFGGSHNFCQKCLDRFDLAELHFENIFTKNGIRPGQTILADLAYEQIA